jgi:hypothetical protein
MGRRITHPCGTAAAYNRHLRDGEPPCEPCRLAALEAGHRRRFRKGLKHSIGRCGDCGSVFIRDHRCALTASDLQVAPRVGVGPFD